MIPDGVTLLEKGCFAGRTYLKSVRLPATVKTIGAQAFMECKNLVRADLPDGLRRLSEECFSGCESLAEITIPQSVASIRGGAFRNCRSLVQIRLPDSLRRNIESCTFSGCTALRRVYIPEGVHTIKSDAFRGCTALEEVVFASDGVRVAEGAFRECERLAEATRAFIKAHTPDRRALDIRSMGSGLSGRLSNYTERHFVLDGVECGSIEGVLQSFKCPDEETQREICRLWGGQAKNAGLAWNWQERQTLYWRGQPYARQGEEYRRLLDRLYDAAYEQAADFRRDLREAADMTLDHSMGLADPKKTVLTREEFLTQLYRLGKGGRSDAEMGDSLSDE